MAKEKTKVEGVSLELPKFQMSYPYLFTKAKYKGEDQGYKVDALFDKEEDLSLIKKAITKAKVNMFGKNKDKWPKVVSCIKDGDEKQDQANYEGKLYITLKSKVRKPVVVDKKKKPIEDESEVYGGRFARAAVMIMIVKSGSTYYSACYINAIQVLEHGEAFGGGGVDMNSVFNSGNEDESDDESNYEEDDAGVDEDFDDED